jgi:hypothetical protein
MGEWSFHLINVHEKKSHQNEKYNLFAWFVFFITILDCKQQGLLLHFIQQPKS